MQAAPANKASEETKKIDAPVAEASSSQENTEEKTEEKTEEYEDAAGAPRRRNTRRDT